MRLKRVLLLAAAINIMIFALAFTISCSAGDDGKNGKDGSSCTVEKNSDGKYEINCGGDDPVGTFEGGEPGEKGGKGDDGDNGDDGKNGEYCWLGNKVSGAYQVLCGIDGQGTVKGSLDICDVITNTANEREVTIKCGSTTVSLCNNKAFDSSIYFCLEDPIKVGEEYQYLGSVAAQMDVCGKATYNTLKQYCGYASEADAKIEKFTVLNICNGILKPNESSWANEYCQYTGPKTAILSSFFCNGDEKKGKINEGKWNNEYCGYSSINAINESVLKGSCAELNKSTFKGPNEESFGKGYCIGNKDNDTTAYVEVRQGTNCKPNEGKWKGEYCGWTSKDNDAPKLYSGICDDDKGPHKSGFNNGFCQADKLTGKTALQTEFCDNEKKTGKPNEGKWKGEYCGIAGATSSASSAGNVKLYSGVCDDGDGPNKDVFNKGYCRAGSDGKTVLETSLLCGKEKINEGEWKGEYCGYADAESTENDKVYTGACDDGEGPNTDGFGSGYCEANRKSVTARQTGFCGTNGKPNEGTWNGEYCGFASVNSTEDDKVYTGACDDNGGPNKGGFDSGYCQWQEETSTGTSFTSTFCGESSKLNENSWKGEYCFADEKVATCVGGTKGDTSRKSTDPASVRCAFEGSTDACSPDRPDLCDETECAALGTDDIEYEWDGECKEK
jgi:hypothetical protein